MKNKNVIFMGTPFFAVPILTELIKTTNVVAVITQPDKKMGRKKILTPSPIKEIAIKNNIKVLQPEKIKQEIEKINEINADIIITCAYGQLIPKEILYHPKYKTINVHASLLPKLRGGAPIQRAIMNNYKKTGITIMFTDEKMDTGNIISQQEMLIENNDNIETLSDKLSSLGAKLLIKTLPQIFDNTCDNIKQNEKEATYANLITREDEHIDFNNNAIDIYNKIRALSNIGAYCNLEDKQIKIFECEIGNKSNTKPGTINIDNNIEISTKDKNIIIKKLQIPGKKILTSKEYINGIKNKELKGNKLK